MVSHNVGRPRGAAAPGVVHIDVAAPRRGEEAAFRDHSCKTHISRSLNAILQCFKPLCKRPSRRSLSYSFTHFHRKFQVLGVFSVSARLCLGSPDRVHDADCELFHM